jgi:hypothetical protein
MEMTDVRWSRVASDVEDVLCRNRLRARSRASSNAAATAEERLLLVDVSVEFEGGIVVVVVAFSEDCEGFVIASSAL